MDEYTQKWISLAIKDHLNSDERVTTLCFCGICGDRATGKHYGAISCDGCKGFFRRSVRNNNVYNCRFTRRCLIDKDKRNQCRYCRLRKCFKVGMKIAAVQNERDSIRKHRGSALDELVSHQGLSVTSLRQAELLSDGFRENDHNSLRDDSEPQKRASIDDLYDAMNSQLLSLVAWAKNLPVFEDLNKKDQLALLRTNVIPHLVWLTVRQSLHQENVLVLPNGRLLGPSDGGRKNKGRNDPLSIVAERIIKELVQPLSRIEMDSAEFACLKAVIFFDPDAEFLSMPLEVRTARSQVQTNLQDHVSDQQYDFRGRFGDLLLALLCVKPIALQVRGLFELERIFDEAAIDETLQTLMADDKVRLKPFSDEIDNRKPPHGKSKLRNIRLEVTNGDTDSSATVSSPNSPGDETTDSFIPVENVTVKIEPDEYEGYES